MNSETNNLRSLSAVITDIKDELKQFVQTRAEMFKNELQEKMKSLKVALPLAVVGVLLLVTAYFLITFAIVGAIAGALHDNPYRWAIGFGAVGLLWALLGGVAAYFAKREFEIKGLTPVKTIGVLKGDKLWMQREAKSA
jgi:uncharacterized membrane protein YqjE